MRAHHLGSAAGLATLLTVAPFLAACGGDDDGPTTLTEETIVGTWNVTSLTAPSQPSWGDAVSDDGLTVTVVFAAGGTYTFTVANDWPADPWICSGTASCGWSGTYSLSGNTLLFDEGTSDEVAVTYSLSGDNLTFTFPAGDGITDPYRYVLRRASS